MIDISQNIEKGVYCFSTFKPFSKSLFVDVVFHL